MNKLDIFNVALANLGAEPIATEGDKSRNGRLCRALYSTIARSILVKHEWTCALERAALIAIAETDPEYRAKSLGYEYQYQIPADCLRIIAIDGDTRTERKKEGIYLYCNVENAELLYIKDISEPDVKGDPLLYSPDLGVAISMMLAYRMAASTIKDRDSRTVYQEFQIALQQAIETDAMEMSEEGEVGEFIVE